MADVVIILGAGASAHAGTPLMGNFLDVATDLWKTGSISSEHAEHFERVFQAIAALQPVHSKSELDLKNIEAIFNAFEMAKVLGKLADFKPRAIDQCINDLKEVIVKTIEATTKFPLSGADIKPTDEYDLFAKLVNDLRGKAKPSRSVAVITFNYDVACDYALAANHLGPEYCLSEQKFPDAHIPLLKLHGSLNWGLPRGSKKIWLLDFRKYFSRRFEVPYMRYETISMPMGTQLTELYKFSEGVEKIVDPFIVPPSWNKLDYHNSLSNVWQRAAKELETAEYIFVIGYSMPETDAFFRLLYALGTVGNTPFRKFTVFDPDQSGLVKNRFESLLGPGARASFSFEAYQFGGAIHRVREAFGLM